MFVKIDNLNINYEKKGKGDEILILHGWGTSLESFRHVIDSLSETNTVYAIDFPGFGMSDEPDLPWDVKDYAMFTKKFIDTMGMKKPVVLGHSFGGRVSIYLSSKFEFEKIILVGCAGIKPTRSIKYYSKVYTYKTIKHMSRVFPFNLILKDFMALYKSKAGSSDYNSASDMMKKVFIRVINEDLRVYMKDIKASTLLVWGDKDTATPIADAHIMNDKIENSGLVVLKGAGHFVYQEKQSEFISIIKSFLEGDK